MTSTYHHDNQEIFLYFLNEVTIPVLEQVTGIFTGRKAIENARGVAQVLPECHGDHAGSFFLLQIGDQIPEGARLNFRTAMLQRLGSGHSKEDSVRCRVSNPFVHVV